MRWNGGMAKYDIRDWDPYHQKMSRGITLKEEEMRRILDLMRRRRMNARNRRTSAQAAPVVTTEDVSSALAGEAGTECVEPASVSEVQQTPA